MPADFIDIELEATAVHSVVADHDGVTWKHEAQVVIHQVEIGETLFTYALSTHLQGLVLKNGPQIDLFALRDGGCLGTTPPSRSTASGAMAR